MTFTIMSVTMMKSVTFTMLRSTEPSVRVRCTTRTAASGDACRACVSVTSCFFFTPETMRFTTRSMTKCRTQRMRNAMAMITTIEMSLPTMTSQLSAQNCARPAQKSPLSGVSSIGGTVGSSARNMV